MDFMKNTVRATLVILCLAALGLLGGSVVLQIRRQRSAAEAKPPERPATRAPSDDGALLLPTPDRDRLSIPVLNLSVSSFLPYPASTSISVPLTAARVSTEQSGIQSTRPPVSRVTPTNEVVFMLAPDADVAAVARDLKLVAKHKLELDLNIWVLSAPTVDAAEDARRKAASDPRVSSAFNNSRIQLSRFFVPNDPLFPAGAQPGSATVFPGQWHLVNANLPAAWAREATGLGVLLGVVDDGCEFTHPDLAENFNAANSRNFSAVPPDNNYGPDVAKDGTNGEDRHGTSVSGVAAAVGGNGIGGTGAAPKASLAINRIAFDNTFTTAGLINAVLHNASGGNTSIKVKNHSYGFNAPYIDDSGETGALATSSAVNTIHVYAAGNARGTTVEDSNKTMPQNSPDQIAVAALGSDDKFATYSSFGANVFVTAPSSSSGAGLFSVTTTDRLGSSGYNPIVQYAEPGANPPLAQVNDTFPDRNYTSRFGGTSAAAPLVTGIMAIVKQANPALNCRLAQHCLVRSSDQVDINDGSATGGGDGAMAGSAWKTNAAGFKFNQNYGFGRINADRLVLEAVKYSGVTPLATETVPGNVGTPIPDNSAAGLDQTFTVAASTPLEDVQMTLNINHPSRGNLEATLISPSGTSCRLMFRSGDTGDFPDSAWSFPAWTFLSNAFWGENPAGTWHIRVADVTAGSTGTWNSFSFLARMGTPIPDTTPPTVLSITRDQPATTIANPLTFTVTFSEYTSGVDASDFVLVPSGGVTGASITSVTGGIKTYTVTINRGSGGGMIGLNLVDNDSILDGAGNPLGGVGAGNGSLVGEVYSITDGAPPIAGTVSDGFSGPDIDTQTSQTTLSAHWTGFSDPGSGIEGYRWAIGTAAGLSNVMPFTDVGLQTAASTSMANLPLSLSIGTPYFVTVEARDFGELVTLVSSDGVQVTGTAEAAPAPPSRVDALPQAASIQVVWLPSPSATVTFYRLWWKPSASPWTAATLVDNIAGTTSTVPGLVNGTSYDFLVRASTAAGSESPGVIATGTPAALITINGTSFGTIQAAINAANPGDTVLIQAGNYSVNLTLPAGITLRGYSPLYTTLTAASGAADVITVTGTTPAATVMMLTVTGGQVGINAQNASLIVRNVVVHHTASHGVSSLAPSTLLVLNCSLMHNGGAGLLALGTTTVRNTIASGNALLGISVPVAASVTYSDSYTNTGSAYSTGVSLSANSSVPVTFTNEPGNDYTETSGSFAVDSGDPLDAFALEPDFNGGRVNLGAFGNTPWAATSPVPVAQGGGGGGGGGCGFTGLEVVLMLGLLRRRRVQNQPGR